MRILIFAALPLMFALGGWQIVEQVYFPHVALLLLLMLSILTHGLRARTTIPKPLMVWTLLFVMSTGISSVMVADPTALQSVAPLLLFVLAVILPCLLVHDERRLCMLIFALLTGAAINAIAGVLQSAFWIATNGFALIADDKWFRVIGTAVTPADYVMQLSVGLVLSELLAGVSLRNFARALFGVCLLFSNSRTALVILALYGVWAFWRGSPGGLIRGGAALVVALLLTAASGPGELVVDRIFDIFNYGYNIKRLVTFENVLSRIFGDPVTFLVGHGYGTFEFFHPIDLETYNNTHNIYLHVLFSGGLVGFVCFFSLIAYLGLTARSFARRAENYPQFKGLANGILLLWLLVLVVGLVETNLVGIGTGWTTGLCLGCALAADRILRRRQCAGATQAVCVS